MPQKTKVMTIELNTDIASREVPMLRGAVIATVGQGKDVLFHNHVGEENFRYAYPLIQYKRIKGKAVLFGLNEGTKALSYFISEVGESMRLGERNVPLSRFTVAKQFVDITTTTELQEYSIVCWLALNEENYREYKMQKGIAQKIRLLERVLKGNILSMCKGLDIHIDNELVVQFTEIEDPYIVRHKGNPVLAFNADFETNINLPENIGIGKSSSLGFGIIHRK